MNNNGVRWRCQLLVLMIFSAPARPWVIHLLRTISLLDLSVCPFQSFKFDGEKVSSGNKKFTCDFTIVLKDEEIENIKIKNCTTKPKNKITIEIVLTSKTMKKFSLTFTLQKSKTKVLSSSVETGSYSSSESICVQNVPSVPCQLGFTRVCNSDQTTLTSIAICPPGLEEVREEYRETNWQPENISRPLWLSLSAAVCQAEPWRRIWWTESIL